MSHPVLQRFERAKKYDPKGFNCIGAAYYLVGLDPVEQYREPGHLEMQEPRLRRVSNLDEAQMIGIEVWGGSGHIGHLAVIHPEKRGTIIERSDAGKEITEEPIDTIFWVDGNTRKYRSVLFSVDGMSKGQA